LEPNTVVSFINEVGFPIGVSMILLWFHYNILKENQKVLIELKTAIERISNALDKEG